MFQIPNRHLRALLVLAYVLVASLSSVAQNAAPADSLFIVTYTTGPAWDASKPPMEQPNFKEHSANLGAMRKEGLIRFGARYSDKGMIVVSFKSLAAAKERILVDPGVANGLFKAEIERLRPFYFGCIEKTP
jgi:hypothetical protein